MRLCLAFLLSAFIAACAGDERGPGVSAAPLDRLAFFDGQATAAIAVDDDSAFVTTCASRGSSGTVMRVPLDGGPSVTLASVAPGPFALAIDEEWVYYTIRDTGSVQRVRKTGGVVETVATEPDDANGADAIALDADHVYWTAVGGVFRAPKTGGAAERIAEDDRGAEALAVDGGEAFWLERGNTSTTEGGVYKVSTSGGPKIPLATGPNFAPTWAFSLAVSGDFVFVPDSAHGRVYRVHRATGEITLVADGQDAPQAIAADEGHVFWSTGGSTLAKTETRTLSSAPIAGGEIEKLVETELTNVYAIAVNRRGAYFTDYVASGSVYAAMR